MRNTAMRRITAMVIAALFMWVSNGFPQGLSKITSAFVDIGIGARAQALGGAYTAMSQSASVLFWNPAGLAGLQKRSVEFSYVNQFGLVPYSAFAGGLTLARVHAFGLGVLSSGDDQLRETTAVLTYALELENLLSTGLQGWQVGLNLKYHLASFGKNGFDPSNYPIFSEQDLSAAQNTFVQGTASGFGLDLGLAYQMTPRLRFGLVVRNLISKVSWENGQQAYDEGIPAHLSAGLAFRTRSNWLLTADYDNALGDTGASQFRFGTEKRVFRFLALRAGMGQTLSAENLRQFSMGMGLFQRISRSGVLSVDYAYQMHPLANSHRFSVGFTF
ncbi:MAG: hypothetical protein D6814_11685 [Calditrichaeota bacterium]|nr:MAG: hypothetical protein D6814_11685 [Calditrichota bacterium]